jgi:hypothetical protein
MGPYGRRSTGEGLEDTRGGWVAGDGGKPPGQEQEQAPAPQRGWRSLRRPSVEGANWRAHRCESSRGRG